MMSDTATMERRKLPLLNQNRINEYWSSRFMNVRCVVGYFVQIFKRSSMAMKLRKDPRTFSLAKTIATFSLSSAQLILGIFENCNNDRAKGIALDFPILSPTPFGPRGRYSYLISPTDAREFDAFLNQIVAQHYPAEYYFAGDVSGRWLSSGDCKWEITGFDKNWHADGGFKCRFDNSWGYIITKTSVLELRRTVQNLFELKAD